MAGQFPCPNPPSACDVNSNPVTAFSSEAQDSTTFIGLAWNGTPPPLNKPFNLVPCEAISESQISQADADRKANNAAVVCGSPCLQPFQNTAQTASGQCSDGSVYSLTIPAGLYTAENQVLADRLAFTAAVGALRGHSICLGSLAPLSVCRGDFYFGQISVITTDAPATLQLVMGELPDGLTIRFEAARAVIEGTPTVFGTSEFVLTATSSVGVVTTKTYQMSVVGIVTDSSLAAGTVSQDYSAQLQAVLPPNSTASWSIISGALPDGLTLNSDTGEITGVPTTDGNNSFTAAVSAGGATCSKEFTITVSPNSDVCTDGVAALLANTYGIQGYFDGLIDNSLSDPSVFPVWDGTFIYFFGDGIPFDGSTGWDNGGSAHHFSIQNRKACSAQLIFQGCTLNVPQWTLVVSDINDQSLWQGDKFGGQTPEGVYPQTAGSDAGPATITIVKLPGASTAETGNLFCSS